MKKILLLGCLTTFSCMSFAAPINSQSSQQDQLGYSYSYLMGRNNADALKDINLDTFMQGLKEGAAGQEAQLSAETMAQVLTDYKKQNEATALVALQQVAKKNAEIGRNFLAENAKKSGVKTTASGLQYLVLTEGTGKKPTVTSKVKVNYEGRLIDGTIFDSSIARDHAVEFQVSQVIEGWTEGLQLMKEGGKNRFFIPAKLAYGEIGSGDTIAPNSTLIFDVELLQVSPQK